ncbi:MAG TPA: ATP-dependent DNA helicase RecG [bacterium]|jgi:ATP-dependent DNA helicase RecG|nr:ATP-dependent DNA helicase RecG [bacterium]HQG58402.1 ATP-dependent DNA helicase RecG [bacterium]HQG78965.1 ATP-dependent DNA helicase RecG [bacterium]HQK41653.1 ATP-dependent DNA helicase RecG [bacterium]
MIKTNSPISVVPKIGPTYQKLLEKLEIFKVEDMLYHFPFRYQDYSQFKTIKDLQDGDTITVTATLASIKNIYTRNGKRITKANVIDHTGELGIVWFNQHYIKNTLEVGKTYNISGKVGFFDGKLCFLSPDMEIVSNAFSKKSTENVHTGRLVPIYPETSGISSKWLRAKIKSILDLGTDLEEFLPEEILKERNFYKVEDAINKIHFPDSEEQAEKCRKRFGFEELFIELLNVEKRKNDWSQKLKSKAFKPFTKEVNKFINSLPFRLTTSQNNTLKEITKDLSKQVPMNRLLQGDVGTGKTVLAIISSYLTYLNGMRVLYMAPTEILAKQHKETFEKLLKGTYINVELEIGSKKQTVKEENWDILIGTHALLFTEKSYKNIGLVIIDEQHRFGVEQRGKLLELSKEKTFPHLLTMTATPIPRTLALTLYGDLSISILKDFPFEQRKVITKIIPERNREEAYKWINKKNEPTFIVCPLIDASESLSLENVKAAQEEYEILKNGVFKNKSVGLLHGRMKSKEKDEVIKKFREGKINVLVSTPVIEVGIDVPDATIMVIESAERYGLASLHQLRGRVGRSQKEGYCLAFMSNNSRNSYKRLKYLEELNSGVDLAEIDLKMRGQGDIFGSMQHGFKKLKIANVNDLKMLEDAKTQAQKYFPLLDKYPKLLEKLTQRKGEYITSN